MPGPLIESMRPHQWVKNLLVFAPLLFAHKASETELVLRSCAAFAAFSLLSGSVYLINDAVDRDADRLHPVKRSRPIAAGRLRPATAVGAAVVLAVLALGWSVWLGGGYADVPFATWPAAYFALNLAYSLWLKRKVIVDCLCISLGFLFRVLGGAAVIAVEPSSWIVLCTFFLTLFLAFCKRREESALMDGDATRATLREYTLPFLDQVIAPLAALSILSYALYTTDTRTIGDHGRDLIVTVPFVVFGVFRYLFLVHRRGLGGDPVRVLLGDRQLALSGLMWLGAVLLTLPK